MATRDVGRADPVAQGGAQGRASEPPLKQSTPRAEEKLDARAGGVRLTVSHLATSASFYERLGLAHTRKNSRFVQFGALPLVDAETAMELSGRLVVPEPTNCRNRVELHVSDIYAAHARVSSLGGPVHPIVPLPWGELSFHCLDPDGNLVEVIEKRLSKEKAWEH